MVKKFQNLKRKVEDESGSFEMEEMCEGVERVKIG